MASDDFYDRVPTKCQCRSCGRTWNKGEEADNETLCLRCEYLELKEEQGEDFDWDLGQET